MPFAGRALQRSALNYSAIMNYGHAAPRAQGCEHGAGARLLQRMRFSDRPLFLLDIDDAAAFMMQATTAWSLFVGLSTTTDWYPLTAPRQFQFLGTGPGWQGG